MEVSGSIHFWNGKGPRKPFIILKFYLKTQFFKKITKIMNLTPYFSSNISLYLKLVYAILGQESSDSCFIFPLGPFRKLKVINFTNSMISKPAYCTSTLMYGADWSILSAVGVASPASRGSLFNIILIIVMIKCKAVRVWLNESD